jgi:hypothetical protein
MTHAHRDYLTSKAKASAASSGPAALSQKPGLGAWLQRSIVPMMHPLTDPSHGRGHQLDRPKGPPLLQQNLGVGIRHELGSRSGIGESESRRRIEDRLLKMHHQHLDTRDRVEDAIGGGRWRLANRRCATVGTFDLAKVRLERAHGRGSTAARAVLEADPVIRVHRQPSRAYPCQVGLRWLEVALTRSDSNPNGLEDGGPWQSERGQLVPAAMTRRSEDPFRQRHAFRTEGPQLPLPPVQRLRMVTVVPCERAVTVVSARARINASPRPRSPEDMGCRHTP